MEKGSQEAKEQAKKMREGKDKKKNFEERVLETFCNLGRILEGLDKRLTVQEKAKTPSVVPMPEVAEKPLSKIEGYDLLPNKAREILKIEFPEAILLEVKPWVGGFRIIVDVTHLLEKKFVPIMNEDGENEMKLVSDHRDIPVKSTSIEKDMKERIKAIKMNMGWIKKEKTPEFVEKVIKPSKPLPEGIAGTSDAQYFTTDVE